MGFPRFIARSSNSLSILFGLAIVFAAASSLGQPSVQEIEHAIEMRLYEAVKFLADDAREGRGPGTNGLNQAADYLAAQFAALGLKADVVDGSPFQEFKMVIRVELGATNKLHLVGPASEGQPAPDSQWTLGSDFQPFALGSGGAIDAPLVFAGYGITDPHAGYDDYAGLDVKGKAVVLLRHEPQQDNPHSAFNGTRDSPHASFVRKVANAYEHGAAAVVFCTDAHYLDGLATGAAQRLQNALDAWLDARDKFRAVAVPSADKAQTWARQQDQLLDELQRLRADQKQDHDQILGLNGGGKGETEFSLIPVLQCRRAILDPAIQAALGADLASLEKRIDDGPSPTSAELKGWRLQGEVSLLRPEATVKNVLAVLKGRGPLADETLIIGAHYDHLGFGGDESAARGSTEIHNGADDNGSGAAALIEVARNLAAQPDRSGRRVLFIAFAGEEKGLLGSARYCRTPVFPLEGTVAMLNMDMVGRLDAEKLIIQGVDTAPEFGPLVDARNASLGFTIIRQPGGFGPSDHASFYPHRIPVMHFFTGTHADYHRPSDDVDKLNLPGMRRICDLVTGLAIDLTESPSRPGYVEIAASSAGGGGDRPYFGSIPDFAQEQPGYALGGVAKNSPAAKGGLLKGDIIIQLGESRVGNLTDFDSALRKHKAGDTVKVVVQRAGQPVELNVVLDPPR